MVFSVGEPFTALADYTTTWRPGASRGAGSSDVPWESIIPWKPVFVKLYLIRFNNEAPITRHADAQRPSSHSLPQDYSNPPASHETLPSTAKNNDLRHAPPTPQQADNPQHSSPRTQHYIQPSPMPRAGTWRSTYRNAGGE